MGHQVSNHHRFLMTPNLLHGVAEFPSDQCQFITPDNKDCL